MGNVRKRSRAEEGEEQVALGGLRKRGAAGDGISLLGKWLPSPAGRHDKATGMATLLATRLFPSVKDPKKQYRHLCSRLRAHLRVVEADMTCGRWGEIDPSKVPAKAMRKYRAAFQMLNCKADRIASLIQLAVRDRYMYYTSAYIH